MQMRKLRFIPFIYLSPFISYAQVEIEKSADSFSYQDLVTISEINGVDVFATHSFNDKIQRILKKNNLAVDDANDHPEVYFTNNTGGKYLKVTGGPDLGYGWFYTLGYTVNGKCKDCGVYLGIQDVSDFVVNHEIKLGDRIKQLWQKAHIEYFRSFSYQGIKYYYFEKGMNAEAPFTPNYIYYYKFKEDKLIEIGLGYGMIGENPMLH
jgi:hypothetical protein